MVYLLMRKVLFGILAGLIVAGCSSKASLEETFKKSPATVREMVEEAVRLDRQDDWMQAAEAYDRILRHDLTPEQQTSIQRSVSSLYARMLKAARAGNSEAKATLEFIENQRHRNG
jgi:hypothetical protein